MSAEGDDSISVCGVTSKVAQVVRAFVGTYASTVELLVLRALEYAGLVPRVGLVLLFYSYIRLSSSSYALILSPLLPVRLPASP